MEKMDFTSLTGYNLSFLINKKENSLTNQQRAEIPLFQKIQSLFHMVEILPCNFSKVSVPGRLNDQSSSVFSNHSILQFYSECYNCNFILSSMFSNSSYYFRTLYNIVPLKNYTGRYFKYKSMERLRKHEIKVLSKQFTKMVNKI